MCIVVMSEGAETGDSEPLVNGGGGGRKTAVDECGNVCSEVPHSEINFFTMLGSFRISKSKS